MISILAYLLPFMYIGHIFPSSLSSFLSTRAMHMIMMVTGVPPKHIQQGAEVVLGETPAKIVVIGVSLHVAWGNPRQSDGHRDLPLHAQFMMPNPFNMFFEPVTVET